MKKVRVILLMLLMLLFVPKVYAAEGVAIESVALDSKSNSAVIVSDVTFDGLSLKFDVKFDDLDDFVKYKLVIKNSTASSFELTESTSSSSYITYEYGYEDGSKVLAANSSKTMFITVKYTNAVPVSSFTEGKYTETKSFSINLEDGTSEIVPSTIDGLYCYLVLLIGTLVFSIALLKATKNKKCLVLVLSSMVLIPLNIHAIEKLKITVESKVEINNPNEITKTIYWAFQENGTAEGYDFDIDEQGTVPVYKLVISNEEQEGVKKGSIAGTTVFTYDSVNDILNIPWFIDEYIDYVTEVKIEGRVVPTSTAYWFMNLGYYIYDELIFDLASLNTINVTNMENMFNNTGFNSNKISLDLSSFNTANVTNINSMFGGFGVHSNNINLNLSGWDLSKITDMSYMFYELAPFANTVTMNLSGWNTSNVTNMSNMFNHVGPIADNFYLDLSTWDTSNVTDMSYMFEYFVAVSLDISGWNMSKVTNLNGFLCNHASTDGIIIPETNGNGLANTSTRLYGKDESVYYEFSLQNMCK